MRNPQRSRKIALIFFASGWATCAAALFLPAVAEVSWIRACFLIYGLSAIIFGGGTALFRHFDARAKEAIAREEDIIARWQVDAAAWGAFVAMDRQWNQEADALINELDVADERQEDGIEVIVGRTAVQIGQSIHRLPQRGTPEITGAVLHDGQPAVIELQLYYPRGGHGASGVPYSAIRRALRFPVGTGAWKDAGIVIAHFRGDTPGEADFFHGKGDGTSPEDLSRCYQCGYETHRFMSHCPKCGRSMQSKRWSRRFGWILLVLGIFVSILMSLVLSAVGPVLLHSNRAPTGIRFSGTPEQAKLVLGILCGVELFGITAICYGLFQIVTGRRSKWIIYFLIGIALAVALVAYLMPGGGR